MDKENDSKLVLLLQELKDEEFIITVPLTYNNDSNSLNSLSEGVDLLGRE